MGPVRQAAVAGRFYPDDPTVLRHDVARYLGEVAHARPALGVVAPHAGFVYSGGVAGRTFACLTVPPTVVVLCPNHTGRGARVAVMARGVYRVPGADVIVDEALARALLAEAAPLGAAEDLRAHEHEHAIEVELPFLLARRADVRIVPVVVGGLSGAEAVALGDAVARATAGRDVLVLASSDMSHFLADAPTRQRDRLAIDRLLALDPEGLAATVARHDISMCGVLSATAMLAYARRRGAGHATLAGYATSGEVSGDYQRVVGYAGVVVAAP